MLLTLPALGHGLPVVVGQMLKKAGIPVAAVGIYVHEIGAAQPLLAVNGDANPAQRHPLASD